MDKARTHEARTQKVRCAPAERALARALVVFLGLAGT